MEPCSKILNESYERVVKRPERTLIADAAIRNRAEVVALCLKNRAGVRALLAGLLAKLHNPRVDIRKPYTEIAGETGDDLYSGRLYDERYIQALAEVPYSLPINVTTAFLTPGFRTKNIVLKINTQLEGWPAEMYEALLQLFDDIQGNRVKAGALMDEVIRLLIVEREQRQASLQNLVRDIRRTTDKLPLSVEDIVALRASAKTTSCFHGPLAVGVDRGRMI
jgi:DNA adenine methylase